MPRQKRSPIDYKPQFADGIFRPKEVVEQELTALQNTGAEDNSDGENAASNERTVERTNGLNAASPTLLAGRTNERTRVRHSFDIYTDQLVALADIQTTIFRRTGRKPKMGELVQEALDIYITQSDERSNERTSPTAGK